MKKSVRLFTLLLALVCCVSLFAACKKGGDGEETMPPLAEVTNPDTLEEGSQFELDANGFVKDTLPETMDYNDAKVSILINSESTNYLFPVEYIKDDEVNNVLYKRHQQVQDRLNVTISVIRDITGSWATQDTWLAAAELAGENGIDMVDAYSLLPPVLATRGLLCNLNNLVYPNQEMPWWPSAVTEWTQSGALYFVSSNSSAPGINSMEVMFVNDRMFTDNELESPIQLAARGEWYAETMVEYVVSFAGKKLQGTDTRVYGLVVDDESRLDSLYYGSGFDSLKNKNGEAEIQVLRYDVIDEVVAYIDMLGPMFEGDEAGGIICGDTNIQPMLDKQTAMLICSMVHVTSLKDLDYAPVPTPKRDTNQKEFRVIQDNGYDVWGITTAAKDYELCGVVIEAIASADYRLTAPYYYETHIRDRYSAAKVNRALFDTIRSSIIYDLGRALQIDLGVATEVAWRGAFVDGADTKENTAKPSIDGGTFSSTVTKGADAVKSKLDRVLAAFRENLNNGKPAA